jgi:glutathione S-transferase
MRDMPGALPSALIDSGLLQPDRMLLFWSSRSPFVRKVMIVAHERGVADRIALTPVDVSLVSRSALLDAVNPLGQIPTLVTVERAVLYDSTVICAYLDQVSEVPVAPPSDPVEEIAALRRHALAHGMMEAMVAWRSERNRADESRDRRRDAYRAKILRALDALEAEFGTVPAGRFDHADAALVAALDYGRFRDVCADWAEGRPALTAWHRSVQARPSVARTAYRDATEPAPLSIGI